MTVKEFMQNHQNDKVEINCYEQSPYDGCVEFHAWNTNQDFATFIEAYGEMKILDSQYTKKIRRNWNNSSFLDQYYEEFWYILEVGY